MPNTIELNCHTCGETFHKLKKHYQHAVKVGQKTFRCSKQCTGSRTSEQRCCATCDKEVLRTPSQIKRSGSGNVFCDRHCATIFNNKFKVAEEHPLWNGGNTTYRAVGLKTNPRCVSCTVARPYMLQVHHIDGNRSNSTSANLETVCMNCHGMRHLTWLDDGTLGVRWDRLTTREIAQHLGRDHISESPIYFPRPKD